ncbi:MAG: phosphoenolpyruvate synthase [Epsilonproteobacteria bacterium]|nr:MAG: phosphoenolpyruvate synthase [Campylobacterota bacterium]
MALKFIRFYDEITNDDVALIGGKNASLGEMYQKLSNEAVNVPFGFATTSSAYRYFMENAGLSELVEEVTSTLDPTDLTQLAHAGEQLRHALLEADMPEDLSHEIKEAYHRLARFYDKKNLDVAVRSSATAEDLPDASFAGQQESFLNIRGAEDVIEHVQRCYASLFTDRAISYRHSHGFKHSQVALCTGVQKMVRSESSGVMFTIDPDTGSDRLLIINAIWGLGENVVGGTTNPDEFSVFKATLKKGFAAILKRELGSKALTMIYDPDNIGKTINTDTPLDRQKYFSLTDEEVMTLAHSGIVIEEHYSERSGRYTPMDIEWAKDGEDGELYIVQARPETVHSKKSQERIVILKTHILAPNQEKHLVLTGTAVGEKIASGRVRIIQNQAEFEQFKTGEILVTDNTDPDWEPVMKKAAAVVTNRGGRTCHAAIVAREIGVPAIVGTGDATNILQNGTQVTVSCAEGSTGYVYEGKLEHGIDELDLGELTEPRTKLYMNVGDPQKAFTLSALPNHGVGLARMEFIINNAIKAHPNALVDLYKGHKVDDQDAIVSLFSNYSDPKSFFIGELSKGIGTIAAAFYPKPVIVRTSDFKSNEYKHMLGGARYEPDEENPMIGYRGASRYYSKEYQEAFEWECEALKYVRDEMGLDNVIIMLPFVRTPQEGKNVIEIMEKKGLKQGSNGLKVYAMCEIPANVILADKFLKIFDGYSIGSNDLTQLTLGVDRGSELIAHVFDERNEAVTRMITMAIDACQKANKYIGICGQAPSDYPEITELLVDKGITSISLNSDSIVKTWKLVTELESR